MLIVVNFAFLSSEGLVELEEVHVVDAPAGLGQHLPHRGDRACNGIKTS